MAKALQCCPSTMASGSACVPDVSRDQSRRCVPCVGPRSAKPSWRRLSVLLPLAKMVETRPIGGGGKTATGRHFVEHLVEAKRELARAWSILNGTDGAAQGTEKVMTRATDAVDAIFKAESSTSGTRTSPHPLRSSFLGSPRDLAGGSLSAPEPPGCGPGGRGFESRRAPLEEPLLTRGFRRLGQLADGVLGVQLGSKSSREGSADARSGRRVDHDVLKGLGYRGRPPRGRLADSQKRPELVHGLVVCAYRQRPADGRAGRRARENQRAALERHRRTARRLSAPGENWSTCAG
jgi:hypothetical protein